MSSLPPFDDMLAGRGCPFCPPQRQEENAFWRKAADLSVSSLYLERNQTYRGYSILVYTGSHVTGIEHLPPEPYAVFMQDLGRAARGVFRAVEPDHMNYATLGNVIPHLHVHIIPRYRDDPRWGAPIWTSDLKDMRRTHLKEEDFCALANRIGVAVNGET